MGRHFGDLAKIRHVITYSLSPFEQRAFPKLLLQRNPQPMICMYLTYTWGNHVHSEGKRKVAADYKNEE
ncbi:unnamed protein product [Coregonus sp. 'balchen']|nr:unnamed protein product [Coregonus sp. 'balchen']